MQILSTGNATSQDLDTAFDVVLSGDDRFYHYSQHELVYIHIVIGAVDGNCGVVATPRIGNVGDSSARKLGQFDIDVTEGAGNISRTIGPVLLMFATTNFEYLRVDITTDSGSDTVAAFGHVIRAGAEVGYNTDSEPIVNIGKVSAGNGGATEDLVINADGAPEVHAVDVDAVGGNTPTVVNATDGVVECSVEQILGTVVSETANGQVSDTFSNFFDIAGSSNSGTTDTINEIYTSVNTLNDFDPDTEDVNLASTGLDNISAAGPAGVATTFREKMVQVWMRFFNKVDKTSTQVRIYKDDDSGPATIQEHDTSGSITTIEQASDG